MEREIVQKKKQNLRAGLGQHFVEAPAFRLHGPMWHMIGLDGNFIDPHDKRHPVGPGKRWRSSVDSLALYGNAGINTFEVP